MNANQAVQNFGDGSQAYVNPAEISKKAASMFNQAATQATVKRFWAWITRRPSQLMHLSDVVQENGISGGAYVGTRPVDIHQICGSESRVDDFDCEFHPREQRIRDRWVSVARAFLRRDSLPPVELIQVGECYFVRDGHHRISVARSIGQRFIDAEIILLRARSGIL